MFEPRPGNFPDEGPARNPRLIPAAGGAQWEGTRPEQNDVLFLSGYDPVRGMLIALADGIGLDAAAGQAAQAVVNAMKADYLQGEILSVPHRQALRMIGAAHAAVMAINEGNAARGEMPVGAAAACVLIREGKLTFASAGNVRVFLMRCGMLLQLNRDHLLSLEAEERDILSGEAPDLDPDWAKRVTSFVGMEGIKKIDCQTTPVTLRPGDRVVVMSSGLYGVLSDAEICSLIAGAPAQQAAEAVIFRVKMLGSASQSNISIAVAEIGGGGYS